MMILDSEFLGYPVYSFLTQMTYSSDT